MKNTKSGALESELLDWAPLFQAFADAFEWALDQAADLARNYPEEVAAVERVRTFMRKHVAGQPAHVRFEREKSTCKFWLEPIELARSHGFSARELNAIRRLIRAHHAAILEAWHEHCG